MSEPIEFNMHDWVTYCPDQRYGGVPAQIIGVIHTAPRRYDLLIDGQRKNNVLIDEVTA